MPRFKQTEEILKLMHNKEKVRNIGIIAHIDHGKTTMSDSLLAMAGLMAPNRAGEARALDFLEEEQRRGITIKTANISLLYEEGDEQYVINLIDTALPEDAQEAVRRTIEETEGVIAAHDLMTRRFGSGFHATVDIEVDPSLSVVAGHAIASAVRERVLAKFDDALNIVVHVDPWLAKGHTK